MKSRSILLPAPNSLIPVVLYGTDQSSTVEEACLEVRQVNLSMEIQSSLFIFRPLCVAK